MVKSHNPTPEEALSAWLDDTPPDTSRRPPLASIGAK